MLILEKKKVAAEEARKKREALQLQRLKAAASAATMDASLQSTALRGSEGSASFTSPSLGPKAQAAVDSAREVVRRVLSNKVCQAILNANMHMHVAMSVCFCSYVLSLYFAEVISGRRWQPAKQRQCRSLAADQSQSNCLRARARGSKCRRSCGCL